MRTGDRGLEIANAGPGNTEKPPELTRGIFILLIPLAALNQSALNLIAPGIPSLAMEFETTYAAAQLVISFYLIGVMAGFLVHGTLSDYWGRRKVLIVALLILLAGTAICAVAPRLEILLLGRMIQAFGACAGISLARVMVRDLCNRERASSVLGYLTSIAVIIPTLTPMLGGFLDETYGWRHVFGFLLVYGGLAALATVLWLPETHVRHTPETKPAMMEGFRSLLVNRLFIGYATTASLLLSGYVCAIASLPYIVIILMERSPTEFGAYMILLSAGFIAGNYLTGRWSERFGLERLIATGNIVSVLSLGVLAIIVASGQLTHPLHLFIPLFAMGFGQGLAIVPCFTGGLSVDTRYAGTASSLLGLSQTGASVVVTAQAGLIVGGNFLSIFPALPALPIVLLLLSLHVFALLAHTLVVLAAPKGESATSAAIR